MQQHLSHYLYTAHKLARPLQAYIQVTFLYYYLSCQESGYQRFFQSSTPDKVDAAPWWTV